MILPTLQVLDRQVCQFRSPKPRNRGKVQGWLDCAFHASSRPESQRSYRFAIDDFITWYCSEPRLAFNRTVVLRYRLQLEARHLAASTINLRLAAVRRLAYEAADTGLLSPELAAGIRRVKGAKKLGVRLGNWLTADEAKALLQSADARAQRISTPQSLLGPDPEGEELSSGVQASSLVFTLHGRRSPLVRFTMLSCCSVTNRAFLRRNRIGGRFRLRCDPGTFDKGDIADQGKGMAT